MSVAVLCAPGWLAATLTFTPAHHQQPSCVHQVQEPQDIADFTKDLLGDNTAPCRQLLLQGFGGELR